MCGGGIFFEKNDHVVKLFGPEVCNIYRKSFHDVRLVRKSIMEKIKASGCETGRLL